MNVDLLYVVWNRADFTRASLDALLANTDWSHVDRVWIHDDVSDDGAENVIAVARDQLLRRRVRVTVHREKLRSPVAAMNRYLDTADPASDRVPAFVKIDNDFVVCPGWLPETIRVARLNPGLDILGVAPRMGPPAMPAGGRVERQVSPAAHIGGIGLIRQRVFEHCRPVPAGRFGWNRFQLKHPGFQIGWMFPDMPCFELDRLPFDPWQQLAADYVAKGWARPWDPYDPGSPGYWSWWHRPQQAVA